MVGRDRPDETACVEGQQQAPVKEGDAGGGANTWSMLRPLAEYACVCGLPTQWVWAARSRSGLRVFSPYPGTDLPLLRGGTSSDLALCGESRGALGSGRAGREGAFWGRLGVQVGREGGDALAVLRVDAYRSEGCLPALVARGEVRDHGG